MKKEYYLGLDIGTNSVGWAVTDPEYRLCRFHGKDMWGIRLFDAAEPADTRRMKRTMRRRLYRRRERVKLLQEVFSPEVCEADETFFIRLDDSKLQLEDKRIQDLHPLFCDAEYTDIDYYKEYPTIYHLRSELYHSAKRHDIRLVYLALHHIIKYRGHFLINGDLSRAKDFTSTMNDCVERLNEILSFEIYITDFTALCELIGNKELSRSDKAKKIPGYLEINGEFDTDEQKKALNAVKEIAKLIVGNQGDIQKIFREMKLEEESAAKVKFSDSKFEEKTVPVMENTYPDELHALEAIKAVYDWQILTNILGGVSGEDVCFSDAMIHLYEEHHEHLKQLRTLLKKYCDKAVYKDFFDGEKLSYACYAGIKNKCSEEDFYKRLKSLLESLGDSIKTGDRAVFDRLLRGAAEYTLLPLQRSKNNSVVPKQLHEQELLQILKNASKYLPFLNEKDENGFNNIEKILAIFNYRIPFYVGPLSDRHKEQGANVWMVRKQEGRITPWNFDKMVDKEASNEQFIRRMTNKCTYLIGEDVLPKNSLLYSKYMVLNELNPLKIRGKAVPVAVKQALYHDLFEKHVRVTGNMLLTYLRGDDSSLTLSDLSGFDENYKSSLKSYHDFKKIFGRRFSEDKVQTMIEDIITWITVYGDNTEMLSSVIQKKYPNMLSKDELKAVKRLRYSGWGNFSRLFLDGIEGACLDSDSDIVSTILGAMWETNDNLMQVLSGRYTFQKEIHDYNNDHTEPILNISYDALVKELPTSPANKRAIWQTILITEEIRKIMGCEPKRIFIEMARGDEEKKQRTVSRKNKLLELYRACQDDVRAWTTEIEAKDEREFNSIKLYLYYLQEGRCAYTDEKIDLDQLMSANSKWDRDHIYPQSKIKDDSLDNLVLVNKVANSKKDNELLSEDVRKKMHGTWKAWLEKGFMSKKKYDRLMRVEDFTLDELSGFISRQLVETRQSTKIVADILDRMYEDSSVIKVKAGWVSDFRKAPLGVLKCRLVNDYHHAKDAYLNIVAGNVYYTRFTANPMEWLKKNYKENWSINKVFYFDVPGAWNAPDKELGSDGKWHSVKNEQGQIIGGTLELIRSVVTRNNILYTEYTYCEHGQLFDETLQPKTKETGIRLKKNLPTNKYGGYVGAGTSYFAQVEFDGGKGERIKNIIGVPIYVANQLDHNPYAFINYCEQIKGLKNVKVLVEKIKKNSLLIVDGFPMRIRGENDEQSMLKGNLQLRVTEKQEETLRRVEKWLSKGQSAIVPAFDGLMDDDLVSVFDLLTEKLLMGLYRNRPANQGDLFVKSRGLFLSLPIEEKVCLIGNAMQLFRCDNETTADLRLINGVKNAGSMKKAKNTIGSKPCIVVNQSVTGLFENRQQL